ncbi:hypothetical protein GF373_17710 [bacterium]|nr:hypothetical protein [bacterium]
MAQNDQATEAAVKAVEESTQEQSGIITLSNGVRVKITRIPDLMVQRLYTQFDPPEPPEVEVNSGGKTWTEPNYDDPGYQNALERRTMNIVRGLTSLILLRGFKIVSTPEGFPKYKEDDTWEEELELFGVAIPENPLKRKLLWLEYRVVETSDDLEKIQELSQKQSGISEEDIEIAQERFRGFLGGIPDRRVGDKEVGGDVQ